MKKVSLLGLILMLTGCVSAKMISGPDGSPHQLISCGSVEQCYDKAAEICGKYKIINTSSETSGANGSTSSSIKLLVKCEK